jgi:hypothetical protein
MSLFPESGDGRFSRLHSWWEIWWDQTLEKKQGNQGWEYILARLQSRVEPKWVVYSWSGLFSKWAVLSLPLFQFLLTQHLVEPCHRKQPS